MYEFSEQKTHFVTWATVFLSLGIVAYFSFNSEPEVYSLFIVGTTIIVLIAFGIFSTKWRILYICLAMAGLGFVGAYVRTHMLCHKHTMIKHKRYVKGALGVISEINYKPGYAQVLFCNVRAYTFYDICVRLAVRTKIDPAIKIGDTVKFSAVLMPPSAPVSYMGYDFARVAYFKGISAVGYTTSMVTLHKRSDKITLMHWVERTRLSAYRIFSLGLSKDCAEVMSALLIGKRLGLSKDIQKNVRNSGLAHLFAISGIHLSFVSGMIFLFLRHTFACFESLSLLYNIKKLCAVTAIVGSFFYLLISGVSISALRAFIMVTLALLGIIFDRQCSGLRSLSISALVILIHNPEALLSPSFQMSFAAVLALVSFGGRVSAATASMNAVIRYIILTFMASTAASFATAPYVIYHFHYFSIVGILANIVAIPLTTFVIIPMGVLYVLFYCILGGDIGISYILELSVRSVLYVAEYAASTRMGIPTFSCIPTTSVLSLTLGLVVICLCRGGLRIVGGALFIGCGIAAAFFYKPPDILCDFKGVATMGRDGKLYFATLTGSASGLTYSSWARDNGQAKITKSEYNDTEGNGNRLLCTQDGCVYDGKVLISGNDDFIMRRCTEQIGLVVDLGSMSAKCYKAAHVGKSDMELKGVHYVWLKKRSIIVKTAATNRLWHRNFRP